MYKIWAKALTEKTCWYYKGKAGKHPSRGIPQANAGALDLKCKRDKGNTMEPLPGDTFVQGTSPFEGHKIWSQKNAVHIIYGDSFARKKNTVKKRS